MKGQKMEQKTKGNLDLLKQLLEESIKEAEEEETKSKSQSQEK